MPKEESEIMTESEDIFGPEGEKTEDTTPEEDRTSSEEESPEGGALAS